MSVIYIDEQPGRPLMINNFYLPMIMSGSPTGSV